MDLSLIPILMLQLNQVAGTDHQSVIQPGAFYFKVVDGPCITYDIYTYNDNRNIKDIELGLTYNQAVLYIQGMIGALKAVRIERMVANHLVDTATQYLDTVHETYPEIQNTPMAIRDHAKATVHETIRGTFSNMYELIDQVWINENRNQE